MTKIFATLTIEGKAALKPVMVYYTENIGAIIVQIPGAGASQGRDMLPLHADTRKPVEGCYSCLIKGDLDDCITVYGSSFVMDADGHPKLDAVMDDTLKRHWFGVLVGVELVDTA